MFPFARGPLKTVSLKVSGGPTRKNTDAVGAGSSPDNLFGELYRCDFNEYIIQSSHKKKAHALAKGPVLTIVFSFTEHGEA